MDELVERFPRTLLLAVAAMVVASALGIGLGTVAAWRRGGWIDRAAMLFALGGISVPVFVSAVLLLWFFALQLRWLPPSGWIDEDPRAFLLPAITLGIRSAAIVARMTRSTMIEILEEDYIRTGRAKGVREGAVVLGHGLRNALVPVITLVGLDFGSYLSGSVLTESIFAWPGVGQYALQAILRRDFPAIQGTVLFLALVFLLVNLIVDVGSCVGSPPGPRILTARVSDRTEASVNVTVSVTSYTPAAVNVCVAFWVVSTGEPSSQSQVTVRSKLVSDVATLVGAAGGSITPVPPLSSSSHAVSALTAAMLISARTRVHFMLFPRSCLVRVDGMEALRAPKRGRRRWSVRPYSSAEPA